MKKPILLFLMAILMASEAIHATTVVNSQDGRDVVSGIYYSAIKHDSLVFVTPGDSEQMIYDKIGLNGNILLIQSSAHPVFTGMENALKGKGNTVEVVVSDDPLKTNIDLAKKSGAKRFVIVDPVYGYNTVSALAYSKENSMFLVFCDKSSADIVASALAGIGTEEILLYGYTDKEVRGALDGKGLPYSEINTGDKFDDNLKIADMYFQKNPSKMQIILSDGNSFESTIAAGDDPVVLISQVIPTSTYDYIKQKAVSGQIKVAMLVDQDYAQAAYNLKTSINNEAGSKVLSVLVKYGESPAGGSGDILPVPLFPLPGPSLGLAITNAQYNSVSKALEVTYENTGNSIEYVRSNILVNADGKYISTIGDQEPFPIERGKKTGRAYALDVQDGEISANITSYFGSSKKSYENGIQTVIGAGRVQYSDTSSLEITEFTRDKDTNDLFVTFRNNGSVENYFRAGAGVTLNGTLTTIKDDNTYKLAPSEARMVKFPGIAKAGSKIVVQAEYGARDAFLDKKVEKEFVPQAESGADGVNLVLIGAAVLVILLAGAFYLAYKKMRSGKGAEN